MIVKRETFETDKSILSRPVGYEAINIQVNASQVAGTIYPANNETAQGIILNDVVVGEGDTATVALLKKGYVRKDRLSAALSSDAQAVLPMIVVEDLL